LINRQIVKEPKISIKFRRRVSNFIRLFKENRMDVVCPGFWLLAWANGCPYHCDYCFLQGTFRGETGPVVFINIEDMLRELSKWFKKNNGLKILNAGELSDSLAITDRIIKILIQIFGEQNRNKLLLLTKSDKINGILDLPHNKQTIISFSINPPEVAERFEADAPSPDRRIAAALKCMKAGYRVRIRIDPIIPVENWMDFYGRLAEKIKKINPERVTLGCLRLFPAVKAFSLRDKSIFNYATERTADGRFRPPENLRIKIYRFLLSKLKGLEVGVCKETWTVFKALNLPLKCNCTP
jgi:spore photoproduct lyase